MDSSQGPMTGRIVKDGARSVEPLYAASRLVKPGVLEAEATVAKAEAELHELRESIEQERAAFEEETAARREELASEAERIRKEAYEQASQKGIDDFARLLDEARPKVEEFQDRYVHHLREMVFRIAREVLGVELKIRPEAITDLVRAALAAASARKRVTVSLHPDVLPHVQARSKELKRQLPFLEELNFCEDRTMPRTGVRLETEMGSYDGGLDVQLQELFKKWAKKSGGQ